MARHLVLNYRYKDGIAYYRKAVELDPQLWSARSQLGINLMRLGQEDEPRQQLEMSYDNGYRDAATVNSLRLLDSYKNFVTFRDDTTILQAAQERSRSALSLRGRAVRSCAIATYEKKYKMKLSRPRAGGGLPRPRRLCGAHAGHARPGRSGRHFRRCDRRWIAPRAASRAAFIGPARLWHEMSHVFILTATNYRVPRWFTEGLAVHEETEASPEWGDRVTPDIIAAMRR